MMIDIYEYEGGGGGRLLIVVVVLINYSAFYLHNLLYMRGILCICTQIGMYKELLIFLPLICIVRT